MRRITRVGSPLARTNRNQQDEEEEQAAGAGVDLLARAIVEPRALKRARLCRRTDLAVGALHLDIVNATGGVEWAVVSRRALFKDALVVDPPSGAALAAGEARWRRAVHAIRLVKGLRQSHLVHAEASGGES